MILAGPLCLVGRVAPGWVEVREGRVESGGHGRPPRRSSERPDGVIARGLVDVQVNGAGGEEVVDGDEALARIAGLQLARGVTSFLPTVITTDDDTAAAALRSIGAQARDPASPVAGAHLEGPFLNPRCAGVHRAQLMRRAADGVPAYYDDPAVRLVTLAPEVAGGLELCRRLARRGVTVSLGHTAADAATAEVAYRAGGRMVTHLFNAMPQLHHRRPGIAGWALARRGVAVCVIPDGLHVDPLLLAVVRRAASGRVVLVSDASVAAAAPPGTYRQAGVEVVRRRDGTVVNHSSTLAGSAIALDEGVRDWIRYTGVGVGAALRAASARPARLAGLPGELEPGAPADLVVLDRELRPYRVMKAGRWVRP
jgi:N-acetylglucosamine-6-phosphate deacetylase